MSDFVYYGDIPRPARDLLDQRFDQEDAQEWWNLKSRELGRPRDLWRKPGGASRIKAVLRRMDQTRPGRRQRGERNR